MLSAAPMEILFDIGALIVFLLIIITVPRAVWNEKPQGPGSRVLFGFVILMVIIFAIVSLSTAAGLIATSSSLSHVVLLAVWVLVAILARVAWSPKPIR
jgi:hypothetical protein